MVSYFERLYTSSFWAGGAYSVLYRLPDHAAYSEAVKKRAFVGVYRAFSDSPYVSGGHLDTSGRSRSSASVERSWFPKSLAI